MWSFVRRLFRFAKSEAHSAMEKLEDPIKMTEQGIRDLRKDLQASLQSLAEVKALQIRMKREAEEKREIGAGYEKKAILLLQKGQCGEMAKEEADRLSGEALTKREQAFRIAVKAESDLQAQSGMTAQLEANIRRLNSQISGWEGELATLRTRAKVAGATKQINRQLAQVDSNGTVAMLEKMKDKVVQDEALAESYGQIALIETTADAEIDRALAGENKEDIFSKDSLAALKAKIGITQ